MKRIVLFLIIFVLLADISFSQEKFTFLKKSNPLPVLKQENTKNNKKSISPAKAFLLSFIIPGWGEKYTGNKGISNYLTAAEITLWLSFFGVDLYSNWLEQDYKSFAADHAGVMNAGKRDKYYVNIGNFMNIHDYNTKKYFDREDDLTYDTESDYFWQWDTKENREKFKNMRIRSDKLHNRTTFILSAIFLNHIVSGLNASLCAKKAKDNSVSLNFSARNPDLPVYFIGISYRY